MTYTPFLISNYATALDREVQPWMLPNDSFTDLLDGYVYRGVLTQRDGYSGYATGLTSTYTESRMVVQVTAAAMTGAINGINKTFTINATPPLRRGTFTVSGSNPVQTLTDNGLGYFLFSTINISAVGLTNPASVTTAINHGYTTGDQVVISAIVGTTQLNSPLAYTITVTALNAFTLNGIDATGYTAYVSGGTVQKVAGTINYTTGAVSVTFAAAPIALSTVTATYTYHQGLPVMGVMNFYPTNNIRQLLVADTRYVNRYNPSTSRLDFIAAGTYNGGATDFWSWVNYEDASSNPRLLFANGVVGDVIQVYDGSTIANYAPTFTPGSLNARQLFDVKDRLVLFQTIEVGVLYPRRIRFSGAGADCDNFDSTAIGAGFIDIPDNTHFFGAAFNRDDVLFFTEAATWMFKYSGNDAQPFLLEKIDGSRGSSAAFSVISYLNRTMAASPRGLIISDGYKVERMDNNIPDFSFNDIDADNFKRCFSGFLDEDRDVYTLYPSVGDIRPSLLSNGESDRILVTNFEEDNFAIFRIPLSSMGNFQISSTILWSDLTSANGYPNWDALSAKYGNWNSFPFTKGNPISIGGGHKGEIWKLNDTESEDNPQQIRGMTVIDDNTLRVTTDWNNYDKGTSQGPGDTIFFTGVSGMTQVNNKQGNIKVIVTPYVTFDVEIDTRGYSAYTFGGTASKTVGFEAVTKKFNPYIEMDKKLRCGWAYFYVSTSDTLLTDAEGNEIPAFLFVDVLVGNNEDTDISNPTFKYQVDCLQTTTESGGKRWVKIWINQVGQFLQFRLRNNQAGASIKVHAMMPGFQPVGRLV